MPPIEPRVLPLIAIDDATIASLFAPLTHGVPLGSIERMDDGLVNTVCRVRTLDGATYGLRVFVHARSEELAAELQLLEHLRGVVPAPLPVVVDLTGQACGHPFFIYEWIDGITLNECRRSYGGDALTTLAKPLGQLAATIASLRVPDDILAKAATSSIATALADADRRLTSPRVRVRLGGTIAKDFRMTLRHAASTLEALDRGAGLVHGDFGGRNIIVDRAVGSSWAVSGILDWEMAHAGSPLWDVGNLFRYANRYSDMFREDFARGYRAAGGVLPGDWWLASRLIDATRLVRILDEEPELPTVFDDCRVLLERLSATPLPR